MVLVIDFGGQYSQLIARRVRECGVYCEIVPFSSDVEEIKNKKPDGIILSGGPNSVYQEGAPDVSQSIFELEIPVLGICYGAQLISKHFGGKVAVSEFKEYGKAEVKLEEKSLLFREIPQNTDCWMSHTDFVKIPPADFKVTASTKNCPVAAFEDVPKRVYGVQFHPEVQHTTFGLQMIKNFLYNVCELSNSWEMASFKYKQIRKIRETLKGKKAICALSGGVDSSVAAVIVHKAIGDNLTCIFVDHGLLRKDEGDTVERVFKEKFNMNLVRVNAKNRFLSKLSGVTDPERKRKIIGEEFIRVFEEEAKKLGDIDFLVQGTIYPDVVESGSSLGSQTIKSHHNVGGLPKDMKFSLIEPLRVLFKDEVRALGEELGLPSEFVWRQPFPGPGLAVRVIGEVTEEKLEIVRKADAIFTEEIENHNLDRSVWQYFACLPNVRSVGVMGDGRTYAHTIVLRAVTSSDAMTSEWARLPYNLLDLVSRRIVNEVDGVNRVVYDITSKPPATIEWE